MRVIGGVNIGSEIQALKGLHDDGTLSDQEYKTAKAKMLKS